VTNPEQRKGATLNKKNKAAILKAHGLLKAVLKGAGIDTGDKLPDAQLNPDGGPSGTANGNYPAGSSSPQDGTGWLTANDPLSEVRVPVVVIVDRINTRGVEYH